MLTTRMTPKISDRPLARRKRSAPYERPLNVWMIQKSGRMPRLAQAQQPRAGAAHDAVLVLPAESGRLGLDDRQRPLVAHVEAEVGADGHAVRPDRGDEIPERPRVVADGVVGEAAEIGAEGLLRALLRLGANLLAVTEPAVKIRQRPARVGQADLERREPVEHATEDQMRRGDGGVEWIAEEIAQVEGREPLGADHAERMEQHGQTERGGALEDREEGRIGELPPADIGAHVDAADAGQSRGAIELGERPHL